MKLTRAEAHKLAVARQAKRYAVLVQVDEEGDFIVGYPDLPGCMAHGSDFIEAWTEGEAARKLWTEVSLEEGMVIWEPRDWHDLMRICEGKPEKKSGKR